MDSFHYAGLARPFQPEVEVAGMALKKIRGAKPKSGSKAVVIGAGKSGIAASRLLNANAVHVTLIEKNPDLLDESQKNSLRDQGINLKFGQHESKDFAGASWIIPSPALPISQLMPLLPNPAPAVISEMELAWRFLDAEPVIAVTGTSGKTTCASLTASMLKAQGYTVFLGGNIGTPLSEYVLDSRKADALVLEISSFQLQGCTTFCPRVGILLNLSPNHLDYHKDMKEYEDAKFRLFRCQDEGDLAIFGEGLEKEAASHKIAARKIWLKDIGRFPNIRLFGKHNAINAEAAWQAAKNFGVNEKNAAFAVNNFKPLPHRLENVAEINNVIYVNDSKATTVSALEAALKSFERPIRLLCGGKFKGGDLASLLPLMKEKVAEVCLFGASREIFEKAWGGVLPISWHPALEQAVLKASLGANPGDVILLSPATSSFDLYKDYKARGDDFKRIVENMK